MTYNRLNNPRAYIDTISYDLSTGYCSLSDIQVRQDGSNTINYVSGDDEKGKLFDARPANFAKFDKNNQRFYIQFDTKNTSNELAETNFIAILNHNFHTADAVINVQVDDDVNMSSPTNISTTGNHTKLINADANDSANEIDPAKNGWTLITWPTAESNNRFVRLTITDDGGSGQNFADHPVIGSILIGEYFDLNGLDLAFQTDIEYDGTTIQRSLGGNTYANTTHLGNPVWHSTLPWNLSTASDQSNDVFKQRHGRFKHSLSFSYLADTDVWSQDTASETDSQFFDSTNFHNSFFQKILGRRNPFMFSIDKDSTALGDYGMYRLDNDTFEAVHNIHKVWTLSMDLIETW